MPIPQMRAAGYQPIFYALQGQPLRAVAVQPHLKKSVQVAFAPAQGHQHQHYQQEKRHIISHRVPRGQKQVYFRGQVGFRADKRIAGTQHTIIEGAKGRKFRLLNSIDLRSEADIAHALSGLSPKRAQQIGAKLKIIVGQGGFGKVRLAQAEDSGEIMIVKKMSPKDGTDEIRKFSQIAQLPSAVRRDMMTLDDYAIVPGKNGQPKAYLFEKLMVGGDCASPRDPGILAIPRSTLDRLKLAKALLTPVKGMHQQGLYHRDLKPENYLKNQRGGIKLADPGLITSQLYPRETAGTPLFMPPEAGYTGARADKADAFALGVMLYQLTGRAHPCMDYTVQDQRGRVRLARQNSELAYSQQFLRDCERARQTNAQGLISLKSLALQMMHPEPSKRLSVGAALTGVNYLQQTQLQRNIQRQGANFQAAPPVMRRQAVPAF